MEITNTPMILIALLPDEDELLLPVAPEDDELPPLEDELLLELVMASLLLPLPPLQAATVRHKIAASSFSSSVATMMVQPQLPRTLWICVINQKIGLAMMVSQP